MNNRLGTVTFDVYAVPRPPTDLTVAEFEAAVDAMALAIPAVRHRTVWFR